MTNPTAEAGTTNRRATPPPLSMRDARFIRRAATAGLAIILLVPFFRGPLLVALLIHAQRRLRWSIQTGHLRDASKRFRTQHGKAARFSPGYLIERIRMRAGTMAVWLLIVQTPSIFTAALFAGMEGDSSDVMAAWRVLHAVQFVLVIVVVFRFLAGLNREQRRLARKDAGTAQ